MKSPGYRQNQTAQSHLQQQRAPVPRQEQSLVEIAAELGVEFLLTATIRWDNSQTPSRFRLSCKLVDTKDESYLWAESYDRVLDQIFVLQSELASEITKALGVALATPELDSLSRIPTCAISGLRLLSPRK